MNLRRIALSMLIAITLISGLSLAEDANVSINESEIAPAEGVDATANATDAESSASEDVATQTAQSLEGSWILTMDDARVSMVLYQSGAILFGAANSDSPEPWNAVVSGSISGDVANLRIFSIQDGFLVSTMVAGTAQDGSLTGSFVQSDSQGRVNQGTVTGSLISPDASGYEPANVPAATTATTTAATTTNTIAAAATTEPADTGDATATETSDEETSILDVTTVADTITSTWTGFEI